MLIPCLIGPAQQAIDTLLMSDFTDYAKVRGAILQTLNHSPEASSRHLRNINFGPDYHPRLIGQRIRAIGLRWLNPDIQTKKQIVCGLWGEVPGAVPLQSCKETS